MEGGHDVVLLIDSITRLVRAYNVSLSGRAAGRTLSGGVVAGAITPSRRFFGAARACAEGGSLTVIASCLVDTGSRQDDLVYEELKGTGNSEITLDRRLAERRLFPALNVATTGTRREELLMDHARLEAIRRVRRVFAGADNPTQAMTRLAGADRGHPGQRRLPRLAARFSVACSRERRRAAPRAPRAPRAPCRGPPASCASPPPCPRCG